MPSNSIPRAKIKGIERFTLGSIMDIPTFCSAAKCYTKIKAGEEYFIITLETNTGQRMKRTYCVKHAKNWCKVNKIPFPTANNPVSGDILERRIA